MNIASLLALALDPARLMRAAGLDPDPWQRSLLRCRDRRVLLNCSRQSGKSTVVSIMALHTALFVPRSLTLLLSPSQRQSGEIFRKVLDAEAALGRLLPALVRTQRTLELANGSRIVCLPGKEETVRSYSGVNLLVLDEAARIPDLLYRAVRPMLAVSGGRLVALSTPFGRRGWFYREWAGTGPWNRVQITWRDCPRITQAFIDEERASLGDAWVSQEYETCFTALEGLIYPSMSAAVVPGPAPQGRNVGGIDFGWRNPFAAVWGVVDRDDVLWLTGERYLSRTPLHDHAQALGVVGGCVWFADPAGATEIAELRAAGVKVIPGDNALRLGIAAVTSRLQTGRLRILAGACPNLLREAGLYRYAGPGESSHDPETPVDEHNHALAALRYLIAGLDAGFMARQRRSDRKADNQEPSDVTADHSLDPRWTTLS